MDKRVVVKSAHIIKKQKKRVKGIKGTGLRKGRKRKSAFVVMDPERKITVQVRIFDEFLKWKIFNEGLDYIYIADPDGVSEQSFGSKN
jgi:hypothetical protein